MEHMFSNSDARRKRRERGIAWQEGQRIRLGFGSEFREDGGEVGERRRRRSRFGILSARGE